MVWDRSTEIHAPHEMAVTSPNHTSVVALSPAPPPPEERRGLGTRLPSAADEACYWLKLTIKSANSFSRCS